MKCRHCGAQLSETAKFCGVCGRKVDRETVKQDGNSTIRGENYNSEKENEKNKKNTDGKKGILSVILLLCLVVAGAGFFYYKNKGGVTSFTDGKKSKNATVKEYEDSVNGANNSFSTYYDGYIYYKIGAYLCRQKTEDDGVEIIYSLKDEDAAFIIMDGKLYINYQDKTDNLYKLIKVDLPTDVTILSQNQEESYLYTEDEMVYYCTWNSEENVEKGRVEIINKQGKKTKLFDFPKEYMQSAYYMMDRRYVYYYVESGIKRIDITQKNCNPELVLEETKNQQVPDDFHPYNDKIYYRDVYSDDPTWYEYDIKTKTRKEILTESMFEEEGGEFRIENFRGDYAYVERDSQYDEDMGDIYRLNLKTGQLEWVTESYYDSNWDICQNYIVFTTYSDSDDGTEIKFKNVLEDM